MTSSRWPPPNGSFNSPGSSYPPPAGTFPPPPPAFPPPQPPWQQNEWPQNGWQQNGWTTQPGFSTGSPFEPKRKKWPFVALGLVILVVLGAIGVGVNVYVTQSSGAKKAAATYLSALERGDFDGAYDQWCAEDQAQYAPGAFRAQHEYRQGEVDAVRGVTINTTTSGTTADINYWSDGSLQSLELSRVHGTWQVCPRGDRLRYDMENCSCMTPSQHLESDVAQVLNDKRAEYPLNVVQCPALTALVDGQPVVCHATSRDGRSWDIQAVESNNATYTTVKVLPITS